MANSILQKDKFWNKIKGYVYILVLLIILLIILILISIFLSFNVLHRLNKHASFI
jgi:hypothetical protein